MASVVQRNDRITTEDIRRAAERHVYIKLGEKPGELLLSGALKRWKSPAHASDIYVPEYRVVGPPAAVRRVLLASNIPAAEVDRVMNNGYTADSLATNQAIYAAYEDELQQLFAYQEALKAKRQPSPQTAITVDTLLAWEKQLKDASTTTTGATATRRRTAVGGKAGSRRKPLAERLAAAEAAGKVLDVSLGVDAAKMVVRPTGRTSKKKGPPGVAVISSDPKSFAEAMRLLGPDYARYVAEYNQMNKPTSPPRALPRPSSARGPSPSARARTPPAGATSPRLGGLSALRRSGSPTAAGNFTQAGPTLSRLPALGALRR